MVGVVFAIQRPRRKTKGDTVEGILTVLSYFSQNSKEYLSVTRPKVTLKQLLSMRLCKIGAFATGSVLIVIRLQIFFR